MKVNNIKNAVKAKVTAKVAKAKNKVAQKCKCGKCGTCGTCAALATALAFAALCTGCHMGEQPTAQRAQTSMVRDNVFNITVVMPTNAVAENAETPAIHVEVGNLAQANETSGTETLTASPSNTPTVSTPVQIDARYNDALAAASTASKGVLETLTTASANAVLKLMASKETGTVKVQKTDGTTATVKCENGQCAFVDGCADGSCAPTK